MIRWWFWLVSVVDEAFRGIVDLVWIGPSALRDETKSLFYKEVKDEKA